MNRLEPTTQLATKSPPKAQIHEARVATLGQPSQPLSLFTPLHYEAGYSYPLLIWLHNAGGNERQITRVMPLISMRNYVGLGVRGTVEKFTNGFAWSQSAEGIAEAEERVLESIDRVRDKFNIHEGRVFLAGYESGGTMAIRLALRNPQQFAGAASLAGAFPSGGSPLVKLSQIRKFPLLMAYCRDSRKYPVEHLCQELTLFHIAGLSIHLRQYPCEDELTTEMLHDLDVWTMSHVTGLPADEPQDAPLPSDWN
jgi:phospholipase/carboxylesterase